MASRPWFPKASWPEPFGRRGHVFEGVAAMVPQGVVAGTFLGVVAGDVAIIPLGVEAGMIQASGPETSNQASGPLLEPYHLASWPA